MIHIDVTFQFEESNPIQAFNLQIGFSEKAEKRFCADIFGKEGDNRDEMC